MAIDWKNWLRRWDVQQTGYLPEREARFEAMLDVLEFTLPKTSWRWIWPVGRARSVSGCWRASPRRGPLRLTSIPS